MTAEERAREAMRQKILKHMRDSGRLMTPEKEAFLDEQVRNGTMISTEHPDLEECRKLAEEEARYGKGCGFRRLARETEMGILD